jgi:transposase
MSERANTEPPIIPILLDLEVPVVEHVPGLPSAKRGTAISSRIRYKDFGELTLADYEIFNRLPPHPLWSQVDHLIDFSFADELCAHLYSPHGQRPYAPSMKLKIHLVQAMENLSDRDMEVRLMFDMAIKRFLGVPMSFTGFDHSTIGLNRERMGDHLFHACFHYVLAQAKARQLWGGSDDRWLVDSFHTHARASVMGAYRLVLRTILQIFQHLKRANPPLFKQAWLQLQAEAWTERLPREASSEDRAVALALLVSRAYALLSWFEQGRGKTLFWQWENRKQQLRSLELQALLCQILQQNTRPTPPDPNGDADSKKVPFEKIPRKERPKDRIVNAYDPDVRKGKKGNLFFLGDKIQVVTSDRNHMILEIEPIPGTEPDGQRMVELAKTVIHHHQTRPEQLIADAAYGHGKHRKEAQTAQLKLVSPLQKSKNPTGLLGNEHFKYDSASASVTCPQGHTTTKRSHSNKLEGTQYHFAAADCTVCPMRANCTTNRKGRTFFVSDYYDLYQEAHRWNESEEGRAALRVRAKIERTNNELINHHDMRRPHTRRRNKLRIMAKMKAMAINIKSMVIALGTYKEDPFVRRRRTSGSIPASAAKA